MLTEAWKKLRYHQVQNALYRTQARFCAVAAGRGSGKTELARRYVVRWLPVKKPWPDPMYFYALPTHSQATRVAWPILKSLVPKLWLPDNGRGISESKLSITTVFGSTLFVVGMDKPQRIEGNQYDGGIIDESSDQKPGSFNLSVRPALSHRTGWCWRIGVPKRVGCGAIEFKEFCARGNRGEDEVKTYTWPSSDILPASEIEQARRDLDVKDYNEQYNASWETVGGQMFYAFSPVLNVDNTVCYHADVPLLIGCDFNVDPMAWVVAQQVGPELHIFDELFVRNTNTLACLEILRKRYNAHKAGVYFHGDASGRARRSSASESDYVQIRNDSRLIDARVFFPMANPHVADRVAATNALMCSAAGIRRCKVHPRCANLIRDLENRAYKQGSTEPDDYGDVGHITDAVGYLIYHLHPLKVAVSSGAPVVSIGAYRDE